MSKNANKMPKNPQNSEDETAAIFSLVTPTAKENFMNSCSFIIQSVNNDLKVSLKNELVKSEIHQEIEEFVNRDEIKSQLKMKREKYAKRYQAYETTQEKLKKDREEFIETLQEHFHLFDNFMNIVEKKVTSQNIE